MSGGIYTDGKLDEEKAYVKAVSVVVGDQRASTSYIQRKLSIGYNRAAKLMLRMEAEGVVSEPNYVGKRDILKSIT
tara:strand:- start:414 stop:641 length:228 start_codon:yes stop_codon:yes gene_type:complete